MHLDREEKIQLKSIDECFDLSTAHWPTQLQNLKVFRSMWQYGLQAFFQAACLLSEVWKAFVNLSRYMSLSSKVILCIPQTK